MVQSSAAGCDRKLPADASRLSLPTAPTTVRPKGSPSIRRTKVIRHLGCDSPTALVNTRAYSRTCSPSAHEWCVRAVSAPSALTLAIVFAAVCSRAHHLPAHVGHGLGGIRSVRSVRGDLKVTESGDLGVRDGSRARRRRYPGDDPRAGYAGAGERQRTGSAAAAAISRNPVAGKSARPATRWSSEKPIRGAAPAPRSSSTWWRSTRRGSPAGTEARAGFPGDVVSASCTEHGQGAAQWRRRCEARAGASAPGSPVEGRSTPRSTACALVPWKANALTPAADGSARNSPGRRPRPRHSCRAGRAGFPGIMPGFPAVSAAATCGLSARRCATRTAERAARARAASTRLAAPAAASACPAQDLSAAIESGKIASSEGGGEAAPGVPRAARAALTCARCEARTTHPRKKLTGGWSVSLPTLSSWGPWGTPRLYPRRRRLRLGGCCDLSRRGGSHVRCVRKPAKTIKTVAA
eukprot:1182422-Prorocentrum_minimum.AAC.1